MKKDSVGISSLVGRIPVAGTLVLAIAIFAGPALAVTTYQWNGTSNTSWQTATNWAATPGEPPFGVTNSSPDRINVFGGAQSLIYTSAEGDSSFGTVQIGGNSSNATMSINGGTFRCPNVSIGNNGGGATCTMIVDGGSLISSNAVIALNNTAIANAVLTIKNGNATALGVQLKSGDNYGSTLNLDGGILALGASSVSIAAGGSTTNPQPRVCNFNGGTLKATAAFTAFAADTANVRNGGAIIDANGFNLTIPQPLVHSTIGGDSVTDGGLTKNGTGTLTLSGTNTYTGNTTINLGNLTIGSAGLLGNGNYAGAITNNGTFTFGSSATQTLSGVISDSGNLVKSGSGSLTLTSTNTYSGGTLISGGTLQLGDGASGHDGSLGTGYVTNNASLVFNVFGSPTNGAIRGNGKLTKSGIGMLTLGGTNTYSGGTTISNGVLKLAYFNALVNTGAVNVAGGMYDLGGFNNVTNGAITMSGGVITNGTLYSSAKSFTFSGGDVYAVLAGAASLTNLGGMTTLYSANTYTGGTVVGAGTLLANNSSGSGTGTGAVTVLAGATLGGNGTIVPGVSNLVWIGGTLAPGAGTPTNVAGTMLSIDLGKVSNKVQFASGATVACKLGAPGSADQIRFLNFGSGKLTLSNTTVNVSNAGGFAPGLYTLMSFYQDNGVTLTDSGKPTSGLLLGAAPSKLPSRIDYTQTGKIVLRVTGGGSVILFR